MLHAVVYMYMPLKRELSTPMGHLEHQLTDSMLFSLAVLTGW